MSNLTSEDDILAILERNFPNNSHKILQGRGDDCAVIPPHAGNKAITCDIFAEDAHFRRRYFTPEQIGHKALAVNLSDLASCGATPEAFTLALTLTGQEDRTWMEAFAKGMGNLAKSHNIALIGGDLSKAGFLHISITAWGDTPEGLPLGLQRGQAVKDDIIFVVGLLGMARLGVEVLEYSRNRMEMDYALREWPASCARHLQPEPLMEEGKALARLALELQNSGREHRLALMDVSDGLARDLPRLVDSPKSGLGVEVYLEKTALHEEVQAYASQQRIDPAWFACRGGEDYALLGSCAPSVWDDVLQAVPGAYRVGHVSERGLMFNGRPFPQQGFDHFGG